MISVGSKVTFKEEQKWFTDKYNLSLDKAYNVLKVNPFWCSVTIENDIGKRTGVDTERIIVIQD